jgi:hypothetical protein
MAKNANKNQSNSQDVDEIPPHITEMMGPTPEEALTGATNAAATTDDAVEPASAPIIPNEKLREQLTDAYPLETETPAAVPVSTAADSAAVAEPGDAITDKAVDDITRQESDEILAQKDKEAAELAAAFDKKDEPHGLLGKCKHAIKSWWGNPKKRNATIAGIGLVIALCFVVPTSRYFVLNMVGVRASVNMVVVDEGTGQPLRNVMVSSGTILAQTDGEGKATLSKVKLGATTVRIEKVAFAPLDRRVTVGWGSNPIGDVGLVATGAQYRFTVKDFLSDAPIEKAEASSGVATAVADEKGEIVLTVDVQEADNIEVAINKTGLRTERRTIATSLKETQKVSMVPAKKHVFVSKREGVFDLYKIDVDGKNEEVLLKGTGTERDDMVLATHPTRDVVAVVSTRDEQRNDSGFLLSTLYIVDVVTGETVEVATSERIQIVDWVDNRLVYVQIAAGSSASSPKRHRLISYEYEKQETQELAFSNYFNDVLIAKDVIYYAPSSAQQSGGVNLHRVNADGTDAQVVLDKEVWNIFRADYNTLQLSVQQDWYQYILGDGAPTELKGAPADQENRLYRDSADNKRSLWIDQRDGKGVLLLHDIVENKETAVETRSGLRNPMYWLNDHYAVYRVNTDQETADYVINLQGGKPQKIKDVTNTGGIDRWYYYQ